MKTSKEKKEAKKFKAAEGQQLPIFYKGSIIRIGNEPVEIDVDALGYESKIQFQQALKDKSIIEVGA